MRRHAWTPLIYWCSCQQAAWQGEWSCRDSVQMEKMSSGSLEEDIWQFLISNSTPSSSWSNFIFPPSMLPGIYGGSGVAIMIRISFVQRYLLEEYVLLFNFAEQLELRFLLWKLAHPSWQPPTQSVFNRSYDWIIESEPQNNHFSFSWDKWRMLLLLQAALKSHTIRKGRNTRSDCEQFYQHFHTKNTKKMAKHVFALLPTGFVKNIVKNHSVKKSNWSTWIW